MTDSARPPGDSGSSRGVRVGERARGRSGHRQPRRRRYALGALVVLVAGIIGGLVFARALPPAADELAEVFRGFLGWLRPTVPAVDGEYIEGLAGGEPGGLNPLLFLAESSQQVAPLLFAGLTRLDGVGNVLPDLALSWEASPGNLIWTFRLRPNAVWHDGQAVTARDVTFTINALASPDFPGDVAGDWRGYQASYTDDLTVVVQLPEPDAAFAVKAAVPVLPRHVLGNVRFRSWYGHEFNQSPVGAGPYVLTSWDAGRQLSLTANASYHLGAPALSAVTLRFAANLNQADPSRAGLAFGLTEAAFGGTAAVTGGLVDPAAVAGLAGRRDLKLQRVPGPVYAVLLFNQRRPGGEVAVRQAVAAGLDLFRVTEVARAALAEAGLAPGSSVANLGPLFVVGGPALPGSATALGQPAEPRRDLALAGRILSQAGWRDLSGDGVLQRGSATLRLGLVLPTGRPDLAAAGDELSRQLREMGIAVDVRALTPEQYLAAWGPPFDFDLLLMELVSPADGDLSKLLHSSQVPWRGAQGVLRGGANIAGVADTSLDATLAALAELPLTDAEGRAPLQLTLTGRLVDQVHLLTLWREAMYYAHPTTLEGPAPGPFALYWNIHQWRWR